jgi:hypothetical protein
MKRVLQLSVFVGNLGCTGAKQKQLAQKTVGSRDHCTSRVCSGLVDRVAQGCNIRSPVALA